MIQLKLMDEYEANKVLSWNQGNKEFLKQWSNFSYPLTEQQLIDRIYSYEFCVYVIEREQISVGTVQLFRFDNETNSAKVGCFLIDPDVRGQGIGAQALRLLIEIAFQKKGLATLELSVYDFNKGAIACYENCGFVKTSEATRPNGWVVYTMELKKENSHAMR